MTSQLQTHLDRIKNALTFTDHSHTSQSQVTPINTDEALTILNSPRRRLVIEALADAPNGETISVSDLAETIAATENDCTVEELTSEQRKRVYISLVQQHLLAIDSLIDYDDNAKEFAPTPAIDNLWAAHQSFTATLNE